MFSWSHCVEAGKKLTETLCYCKLHSLENFTVLCTCIYCCVVRNRDCWIDLSLPNEDKRRWLSWVTLPACNSSPDFLISCGARVGGIGDVVHIRNHTFFFFFFLSGFKIWVQYISKRNFNLNISISISCTVCKIVRCVMHELCCNSRWTEATLLNVLTSVLSSFFLVLKFMFLLKIHLNVQITSCFASHFFLKRFKTGICWFNVSWVTILRRHSCGPLVAFEFLYFEMLWWKRGLVILDQPFVY